MNLTYTIPESKKDITVKQYLLISKLYKDAEENETEVNEKDVKVDANHPLAGKKLMFEVELLEVE